MLKLFDAPEEVIAVAFTDRLETADIERFGDQLQAAIKRDGPIHLYVEVINFAGMDNGAMDPALDVAKLYFANLKRFGRIAIVADKTWVRVASRIESLLLPHVSYEVFAPDEGPRAFAWVKGDEVRPRPQAFRMLSSDDPRVIAFEVDGKVMDDELDPLFSAVEAAVRSDARPLRLLGRFTSFDGFDWRLLTDRDYFRLKLQLLKAVDRYALVGGPAWFATWLRIVDPLVKMEVRHFESADEASAWAWLRERGDAQPVPAKEMAA